MVRRGDVRRGKLYYLRSRRGKSARISEKTDGYVAKVTAMEREAAVQEKQAAQAERAQAERAQAERAQAERTRASEAETA